MKKVLIAAIIGLGCSVTGFSQARPQGLGKDKHEVSVGTRETVKQNDRNSRNSNFQVPAAADRHFGQAYGKHQTNWMQNGAGLYTKVFNQGNYRYTAYYDQYGNWNSTERKIGKSDLPMAISRAYFGGKYGNFMMRELKYVVTPQYRNGVYVVVTQTRQGAVNLYYNAVGRLMKVA